MDTETSYPYWYKLILYWTQLGHDGLTIPFILGAKKILLKEQVGKFEVQKLFNEIMNTDLENNVIRFYKCEGIKEKVLGLLNRASAKNYYGKIYLAPATKNISLVIGNELSKLGKDIDEIALSVYNEYKDQIENNLFSKRYDEWHTFDNKDLEMVQAAFYE